MKRDPISDLVRLSVAVCLLCVGFVLVSAAIWMFYQ